MGTIKTLVIAAVTVATISVGNTALAHAAYKSSEPPDKGRVGAPPSQVSAEFTEPLAGGSYLQITDPCGDRVDGGDVSISGYTMSVSMNGSASGTYTVFYRAHSQLDPHVTQGEFTFTATSGQRCAGAEPEPKPETRGGGGSGSQNTSSTGGTASSGSSTGATGSTGSAGDGSRARSGGDRGEDRTASRSGRSGDSGFERQRARVPNIAAAAARETRSKPIWDGIKLDSFLTGLLLAAIIGAAGGKIYAGIMGPRA